MKIKLLIILFFSFGLALCQTPTIQVVDSGNADGIYKIFETLDTSKITTGIFYDKVLPFVDVFKYDGKDSIGIGTSDEWREIYFEMNKGAVNNPRLPNIANTFQNANDIYTEQNIISIGILNVKYNMLKDSALEKGLVYLQGGQIYDTPNKSESPYNVKRVFSATSLINNIQLSENKFMLSDGFYFSNDTLSIDHFEIDFDDGMGVIVYQKNEVINISYDYPGDKNVNLKVVFNDNSELNAAFKITTTSCYVPPIDLQLTFDHTTFPSMIPYSGWYDTGNKNDKNGNYGKATVTIWYAPGNHVLTKPLILLDGFDPEPQRRHYEDLYCDLNQVNTADILRSHCYNYDIIVVDWDGGADWIQKNSLTLVEILKWINANKVGGNKNIIVGPSMGGIIGRYALSYMEHNNIPHDVGVFVPWDSPHRGANIPLGLQYWVNYYSSDNQSAQDFVDVLNSPAAKQLLNYHYDSHSPSGAAPLRQPLLDELNNYGNYPSQPLLIGIANGSGIGHYQNNANNIIMYPSSEILETQSQKKILGQWINVASAQIYALPAENDGEKDIFHGTKGFSSQTISVWDKKPYDNAPGGFFPHLDEIPSYSYDDEKHIRTYTSVFHPYVDFIPTISALDLDHSINDLFYNPINVTQTPFDYIISTNIISSNFEPGYEPTYPYSWNEQHSSITTEKRDFLINLIGNNFPTDLFIQNKTLYTPVVSSPVFFNATNSITAGNNVDINQTQGDVIITPGNNITFRAGAEINLEPGFEADHNFEAYIEPFETVCDPTCAYSPNIAAIEGIPDPPIVCVPEQFELYATLNHPTGCYYDNVTYNWWVIEPNGNNIPFTDHTPYLLYTTSMPVGLYQFHVQAVNDFGNSNDINFNINVLSIHDCDPPLRKSAIKDSSKTREVSLITINSNPNPNNGIFTISKTGNSDNINSIEIYNVLGYKIEQSDFETNTKLINISQYPQGLYIIKVYSGNNIFVEKIIYQ